MTGLDKLLDRYSPPRPPADLAERAVARALSRPQQPAATAAAAPRARRDRRGGWRRTVLAGAATMSLAFTSAVAATVASGGRIDIPVVRNVVASVPVLRATMERAAPPREVRAAAKTPVRVAVKPKPPATPVAAAPERAVEQPALAQRYAQLKKQVAERRAAGLPTPRADRIEAAARAIVERRQAAGKPVPPVEQVEAMVAMRMERRQQQRIAERIGPDEIMRFADRLPPERRAHYLSLPIERQKMLLARALLRMQQRRSFAQGMQQPVAGPTEGSSGPPR